MPNPNLAEVEALVAELLSPVHRSPVDPKAVYRTRRVGLFEETAAVLTTLLAEYRRRGEALERAAARIPCELGCYPICQHETVNKSLCCDLRSGQALGGSDA